jgi:hypothetical protein
MIGVRKAATPAGGGASHREMVFEDKTLPNGNVWLI